MGYRRDRRRARDPAVPEVRRRRGVQHRRPRLVPTLRPADAPHHTATASYG